MTDNLKIVRTNSENPDFLMLVRQLDIDLAQRDGNDHSFYAQFNKIDKIKHAIVVYENDLPVGCGAIKEFSSGIMEVKRMFTLPEKRGSGIGSLILKELEKWSSELSCTKCILETGKRQPEAINLYRKNNYHLIPNFGQYEGVENSVCFQKEIN